jgi:hypothetical protein
MLEVLETLVNTTRIEIKPVLYVDFFIYFSAQNKEFSNILCSTNVTNIYRFTVTNVNFPSMTYKSGEYITEVTTFIVKVP